ncbi:MULTISPECIES: hypothetical protein [Paraburkholderia]|uniref:hypothetical protein n=1 Tax=Paraburkholderia TaxID=1822464 RepID=UPI00225657CB|nr:MULTISPECIES: hypothetical protein [Paraburkholderia]MCX4159750.1 hypothetical protein [Paraburkholderia aspalathi]MDN7169147.1 hypothetical protein [Paraburkholderia sp. SECH2]MDQ6397635.1 hypothetical protein [Paraburkholderia aspalathi]
MKQTVNFQSVTKKPAAQKLVKRPAAGQPGVTQVVMPTRMGPCGLRYDFNDGVRVLLPKGEWRVELRDLESGNVLFRTDIAEWDGDKQQEVLRALWHSGVEKG